jgi:hypothetical protein
MNDGFIENEKGVFKAQPKRWVLTFGFKLRGKSEIIQKKFATVEEAHAKWGELWAQISDEAKLNIDGMQIDIRTQELLNRQKKADRKSSLILPDSFEGFVN